MKIATLLCVAGAGSSLALGAGYLGALHPAFDTVAVIRLHVLIALGVVALLGFLLRKWRLASVFSGVLGAGLGVMIPNFVSNQTPDGITLLQSNLLFRNDATALAPFTHKTQPDILTVQEVTERNRPSLIALKTQYPTQIICEGRGVAAILTTFPEMDGVKGCDGRVAWIRVMTPKGPLTIVSLHLLWPWPNNQPRQVKAILPLLEGLPRPIILGGDFNTVSWSHSVHQIEAATGTHAISGIRLSFDVYKGLGRFPIDHVLVPVDAAGYAQLGPELGSDHKSIMATIAAPTQ